jgi:hypothetical protein
MYSSSPTICSRARAARHQQHRAVALLARRERRLNLGQRLIARVGHRGRQ